MTASVSVRHLLAGEALRRHREAAGFSPDDAAAVLGWSRPKLSGFEAGQRAVGRAGLLRALAEFGAGRQEQETLATLAADRSVWWRKYAGCLPRACTDLAALLTCASAVTVYEARLIPLLLQTLPYAQLIAEADRSLGKRARAALPKMVADLQKEVLTPGGVGTSFVVGESAVRNRVDEEIMREQAARLSPCAGAPGLRILPDTAAPHPAFWTASMTLLDFPPGSGVKSVVHLGGPRGGVFVLGGGDVACCAGQLSDLRAMALPGESAACLIAEAASGS